MEAALDRPHWTTKTPTFICDGTDLTPVSAEEMVVGGLRQIMEAITKLQPVKLEPALPPEPKPAGSLLSVSEVALIIGITEDTVRKWARAGKITSVRLSKVDVRFRPADVDEFIGSRLHRRKSAFRSP
jgi:excisionase family DNA binding protein